MEQNRIPLRRRPDPSALDPQTVDRLVATVLEGDSPEAPGPVEAPIGDAEREMLRVIASIREIDTAAPPLSESQVEAIMATLQGDARMPLSDKWHERLGMVSGFLASAFTLGMGLVLVGGAGNGGPPDIGAAAVVASLAAAGALLFHKRPRRLAPMLPVLAVIPFASCTSGSPESGAGGESRTFEIDSTAVTVFEEGEALWGVRDIVQSGEAIWVLTEAAPFLRTYDSSGHLLAEFGIEGEGPGELRNPWALATTPTGGVIVWDLASAASRLVFTKTGAWESSTAVPIRRGGLRSDIRSVTFGDPFRFAESGDEILVADYPSGPNHADEFWLGKIVRFTKGTPEPMVLVDFAVDLEGSASRAAGLMGLSPVPLWDRCPSGSIAVLDPVVGHLHLFGSDGSSGELLSLPWSPRPLLPEELLGYIRSTMQAEARDLDIDQAEIDAAAEEALARAGEFLPTETPLGVDLRCAGGRAWIQEFDGLSHPLGYGRAWRTVSVDDRPARFQRVIFPDRFAPFLITDSTAIGVVTDSVDLQRVAVVRLPS